MLGQSSPGSELITVPSGSVGFRQGHYKRINCRTAVLLASSHYEGEYLTRTLDQLEKTPPESSTGAAVKPAWRTAWRDKRRPLLPAPGFAHKYCAKRLRSTVGAVCDRALFRD